MVVEAAAAAAVVEAAAATAAAAEDARGEAEAMVDQAAALHVRSCRPLLTEVQPSLSVLSAYAFCGSRSRLRPPQPPPPA